MIAAALRWEALPPVWLIVLVIIPALALTVRFFYRREAGRVGRPLRIAMGGLRILAVLLVLTALWGPYTETVESQPFKRHLIIAIDTSESMGFRDGYESNGDLADKIIRAARFPSGTNLAEKQRIEIVRRLIGADRALLEKLADTFRLHIYTFDSAPAGLVEPHDAEPPAEAADRILAALPRLKATGAVTRIGVAIRDLVRAFDAKNEPVAGIVMFTDGRYTGGPPDPIEEAQRAAKGTRERIPIFPVAMGNPATAVNIGVSRVDAPEVVLAGDEVSFTVHVHARGLENKIAQIEAWVLDADGNPKEQRFIDAEPFNLPADDKVKKISFRDTFDEPGTYDLMIGVPPHKRGEAVTDDNYKVHHLTVAKLKMRVLLVAEKPSYTYRFLKEALFRASHTMETNALLLSAEPDWPQEASSGVQPIQIFPQTKQELAPFDVIILLDVDPANDRVDPTKGAGREDFANRLEEWVKQGGGLVLEAGRSYNIPSRYRGTSVMSLMPVVPYAHLRNDVRQDMVQSFAEKRHKLTSAGADHPVMRILKDPVAVRAFWDHNDYETKFYWYAPVKRTKSSATALTERRDRGGNLYRTATNKPHPVMAIQTYGLGKVFWMGTDELWRLRARHEGDPNIYYWRFWSGVIRHLATYRLLGGNRRIKIWVDRTDRRYRVGDTIGIEAKFLDKEFEPVKPPLISQPGKPAKYRYENFTRKIKLRRPDGEEEEVTLYGYKAGREPEGLFQTQLHAGEAGTYRLVAEPDGNEEPAEATFVVESKTIELADPLMDMKTLLAIAKNSQEGTGRPPRVLQPHEFQNILDFDEIPRTGIVRSGETHRTDLWDRAWLLWVFAGLLAAEWILRRLNLLL